MPSLLLSYSRKMYVIIVDIFLAGKKKRKTKSPSSSVDDTNNPMKSNKAE